MGIEGGVAMAPPPPLDRQTHIMYFIDSCCPEEGLLGRGGGVLGHSDIYYIRIACPACRSPPPWAAQERAGSRRCRVASHIRGSCCWWGPLCSGPAT
jgi:hypothetical protein